MTESKISQRAFILQEIAKLRALPAVDDKDVEKCILSLSSIEDKVFLCSTLLKEINGSMEYFDGVLAILAINLGKEHFEKCVFNFLDKPNVSEEKKLFLINMLKQAGIGVDSNLIHAYIENPDEIVDMETEKFLEMAEVNPEAQIDFLDFYFGINENDRNILLKSITEDYSGDILSNILAPLVYSITDEKSLKMCIEGFLNSKSYLAYSPLDWLIKISKSETIVSLAKKIKNELKIAGLRKDINLLEYYKELFKTSKPLSAFVSPIDGASNFSLVFAREYENGTISTFFAVLNLEIGVISCFGLSNISKTEYGNILLRFFKDTVKTPVDFGFARALIDEFIDLNYKNDRSVPYEILCWRQLTYDIEPVSGSISDIMASSLKQAKIEKIDTKRVLNSDCILKWFFTYDGNYPEFTALIDEICALSEENFGSFDEVVLNFIKNSKESSLYVSLKKRFLYQSYFFKQINEDALSDSFYTIFLSKEAFDKFYELSIKKSVYEFFLNLENVKETTDFSNVFSKQRKIKFFDFNSKLMLKLIEEKWIN